MKTYFSILSLIVLLFVSCDSKKNEYDPYAFEDKSNKEQHETTAFEIEFKKTDANLKTVHIKLNDVNGYDALFDTGCSSMLISSLELTELFKTGTITEDDYIGDAFTTIADGSKSPQPMYRIKEVKIVDKQGKSHSVRNIIATVVKNPVADVLIGSAIIDNLAKKSYTIDLKKNVIRFE